MKIDFLPQESLIFEKNGIKVGLLGYCMNEDGCSSQRGKTETGPAIFNTKAVRNDVADLREKKVNDT